MKLVCPGCRGDLLPATPGQRCAACAQSYPTFAGLPIFLANAALRLRAQLARATAQKLANREAIAALDRAVAEPRLAFRAQAFSDRREGLQRQAQVLQGLQQELLEAVARTPVAEAAGAEREVAASPLAYLFADWAGGPEEERANAQILAGAADLLAAHRTAPECHAIFLGAGTGRHAVALSPNFTSALAVDASLEMAWHYARAARGPLPLAWLDERAPLRRADLTRLAETRAFTPPAQLRYAVADAAHLPVGDGVASHLFSLFFTDLLPLPVLLGEAARVLQPGGVFLHVGPLHYGFEDFAWRLSVDELPEAFSALGFALEPIRQLSLLGRGPLGGGEVLRYQAFAFAAKRSAEPSAGVAGSGAAQA